MSNNNETTTTTIINIQIREKPRARRIIPNKITSRTSSRRLIIPLLTEFTILTMMFLSVASSSSVVRATNTAFVTSRSIICSKSRMSGGLDPNQYYSSSFQSTTAVVGMTSMRRKTAFASVGTLHTFRTRALTLLDQQRQQDINTISTSGVDEDERATVATTITDTTTTSNILELSSNTTTNITTSKREMKKIQKLKKKKKRNGSNNSKDLRREFIGKAKAVDRGQWATVYSPGGGDGASFVAKSGLPDRDKLFTVLGIESSCDDTGGRLY